MPKLSPLMSFLLASSLLAVSATQANAAEPVAAIKAPHAVAQKSYGTQVGDKALNGITNLGTGWLEIPKNVVNTTEQTNILYGMIGGLGMGIFNTLGRMGTGLVDLVSAPFPTDPIVTPVRAWNNFDTKTTYGVQHHLEEPTNQMPTAYGAYYSHPNNTTYP